jgi:REP element-mobilizing transposase RayT
MNEYNRNAAAITSKTLNNKAQGRRSSGAPWVCRSTDESKPQRGFTNGIITMPQSLALIYVHLVFSTKERRPFLQDPAFRSRAHAYLAGICENQQCPALSVGGVEDHVHVLCRLSKIIEVATLVRELKRDSSKWVKDENPRLANFHWQNGYGAFSASPSHVDPLREYIANQVEHHRGETFQDEFRRTCQKYGVEIDERYVWD